MTALTITHNDADGTLIDGTARGDGSNVVLKRNGWRWSKELGFWFVPRSRDAAPKMHIINSTTEALQAAGFEVETEIDATVRDQAEREAEDAQRSRDRSEALEARAARHRTASDAAFEAGHQIADGIPMGQPVLVGHHSEKRHRRDLERIERHQRRSFEEHQAAEAAERAAQSAAGRTAFRNNPHTVANRIDRLEAKLRSVGDRANGEEFAHERAQLEYWKKVRAEQLESGQAIDYGPHNVKAGDAVQIGGTWHRVRRANKKTVTIEYAWHEHYTSTGRVQYHQIRAHRAAE